MIRIIYYIAIITIIVVAFIFLGTLVGFSTMFKTVSLIAAIPIVGFVVYMLWDSQRCIKNQSR